MEGLHTLGNARPVAYNRGPSNSLPAGKAHAVSDSEIPSETPASEPPKPAAAPRAGVLRADSGNETAMVFFSAVVVGLVAFFLYFATLAIPLHGPDLVQFGASTDLHRLVTAPNAVATAPHAPLTIYGYALNWELGGTPNTMHLGSLLLHVGCAVLTYLCARRLVPAGTPEPIAMLGGLLLATSPVAAEALGQITARGPMQAAFFALIALWFSLRSAQAGFGTVVLIALAYAAAVASHAGALMLPVVMYSVDIAKGGHELPRVRRALYVSLTLTALGLIVTNFATGEKLMVRGVVWLTFIVVLFKLRSYAGRKEKEGHKVLWSLAGTIPFFSVILVIAFLAEYGVIGFIRGYMQTLKAAALFAGASPLSATISEYEFSFAKSALLLFAVLVPLAISQILPATATGFHWLLMLALGSALFVPADAVLAQGASYLPAIGLALTVPALLASIKKQQIRVGLVVFVIAWIVGGGVVGFGDLAAGADPDAYWKAQAERTQDPRAWRYLAEFRLQRVSIDGAPSPQEEALPALQQWHEKAPDDARAAGLLGTALAATGKGDEAIPVLLDALRLNPWNGIAAARLASIYEQRARTEGRETLLLARDYYARANALGALDKAAMEPYALVLAAVGDLPGATQILKLAVGDAQEGPAVAALKRFEQGAQQIRAREEQVRASLTQGGDANAIVQRAEVEFLRGRTMQTFYLLERVLRREGENVPAWTLLGLTCARMQRVDAFISEFGTHASATAAAWEDLSKRCAGSGQWDAALAFMERAPGGNAELRLATMAQELRQPQRAEAFLQRAADKAPTDPLPLLRLTEFAIAAKDLTRAGAALAEAQRRGATEEQLKPLRDQMGTPSAAPGLPQMQKIVE